MKFPISLAVRQWEYLALVVIAILLSLLLTRPSVEVFKVQSESSQSFARDSLSARSESSLSNGPTRSVRQNQYSIISYEQAKEKILDMIGQDELRRSSLWSEKERPNGFATSIAISGPSLAEVQKWEDLFYEVLAQTEVGEKGRLERLWERLRKRHIFEADRFRSVTFTEPFDPKEKTKVSLMETAEYPSHDTRKWTFEGLFYVGDDLESWPYNHFLEKESGMKNNYGRQGQ